MSIFEKNPQVLKAHRQYKLRLSLHKQETQTRMAAVKTEAAEKIAKVRQQNNDLRVKNRQIREIKKNRDKRIKELKGSAKIQHFENETEAYAERPIKWVYNVVLFGVVIGLIIFSIFYTGVINPSARPAWKSLGRVIMGFFNPDWSLFFGYGDYAWDSSVIYLSLQTLGIAFIGTLIGSLLALPFGFLASRKLVGRGSWVSMGILVLIRTFPEIILGLVLITIFGMGAWTGAWVLAIHSIGMIGKMYADNLDSQEFAPVEALQACGATKLASISAGVVPEVLPNFVSTALYRFDLNVRSASILGLVGGGGIGQQLLNLIQFQHWEETGSFLLGLIIITLLVDFVSTKLRKRLV